MEFKVSPEDREFVAQFKWTMDWKGVYLKKRKSGKHRWCAQINVNGTKKFLGYCDTKEEAHDAYKRAAVKAFGEYASV